MVEGSSQRWILVDGKGFEQLPLSEFHGDWIAQHSVLSTFSFPAEPSRGSGMLHGSFNR